MSALFSGGCACGAIRYECSAESLLSEICYCRDCQHSSGNASAALLVVPLANFTLISGSPKYYRVMGTSGYPMDRGFCPECGSPVVVKAHRAPDLMIILAASLDDTSGFRPQLEVWTGSAPPWACLHPTLPKIQEQATDEDLQRFMTPS
ncbi:MAG: GFA family protein [Candidatus Binataceae bacterium]